jgi:hypothetical protein
MAEPLIARRPLHRAVFAVAAIYNVAWGAYAVLDPQWLFRFAGLPPMQHPQVFACLGMVIGLYGLLYAEVSRRPEHGLAIAAVGLAGKLLGPIGLVWLIATGVWPIATIVLCLTNDLIWWVPFTIYLRDAWSLARRPAPVP